MIATCAGCSAEFQYESEFYEQRRWHAPRTCERCRAMRRARTREQLGGEVVRAPRAAQFAIIRGDDGLDYIARERLSLPIGARVTFRATPAGPGYKSGLADRISAVASEEPRA